MYEIFLNYTRIFKEKNKKTLNLFISPYINTMENVLQKDVNQRFIEEINRLKANGKIKSEGKFAVQVGLSL